MRFLNPILLTLALLVAGVVFAHATLVLGTVSSTPANPQPGEDFQLSLKLEDPTGLAVEDAVVFAEFRPPGDSLESEPVRRVTLEETSAGSYAASLALPSAGEWSLFLRDQTFRQEEATAQLTFVLGERANDEPPTRSFVFPPTATSAPLRVWLYWMLGVPLLAAVVVTVLVLTNSKEPQKV